MMTDLAMRGRMLLWTVALVTAAGAARAGGDAARGEKLYEDCAACHSIERGVNGVGPTLYDIFGRKAGELDDYRYSPALKRSDGAFVHSIAQAANDTNDSRHAVCADDRFENYRSLHPRGPGGLRLLRLHSAHNPGSGYVTADVINVRKLLHQ